MGQVRKHILLFPLMSFYSLKSPPGSYNCMQNTELLLVFFETVKQRKRGAQRYCLHYVLKIKKACAAEKWLMSFLSVRILLCTHNTGLPVQVRGNKDWIL